MKASAILALDLFAVSVFGSGVFVGWLLWA